MSGKRETQVVSGGGGTSGFSPSHLHLSRRAVLLAVAAVVLVAGLFAYQFHASHRQKSSAVPAATQKTVDEAVNKTVEHPNYVAATNELNDQIKATKDNKKRATLYISLTSIALQQGKYQEVVDDELKAIQADPSREGEQSRTIADAYYQLGNKPEALKYYQKSLDYYKSRPDNFSGRTYYINSTQAKITELSK